MPCFLDYGIVACYFENPCAVAADDFLKVLLVKEPRSRHFVERNLLVNNLIVGVQECFQHIDSLLDLADDLLHGSAVAVAGHSGFMYPGNRALACRHAFDVEATAGEDNRELVEKPDVVFRKNGYSEKSIFVIHCHSS